MIIAKFSQITGPHVRKDTSVIDREDSRAIKKFISIEPRKKYALVHEQIGIFAIGKKKSSYICTSFCMILIQVVIISMPMFLFKKNQIPIIYLNSMEILSKFHL
jgi:hypothetical protein